MSSDQLPLCIDCDGTLLRTDLLHESVMLLLKRSWYLVFALPIWLMKGKAHLKQRIAARVELVATHLPYDERVVELVRQARQAGRTTVLATASPRGQANAVAVHVGLFDEVFASDGRMNLSGANKAAQLVERFGLRGFVYAGNSSADLPVWAASAGAVVVNGSPALAHAAATRAPVLATLAAHTPGAKEYLRAIRLHQWAKNILVFVPVLAAHEAFNPAAMTGTLLAFLAFSLCASAVYVINDLLDLPSDRQHTRKRNRPFASGAIPIAHGVILAPALLLSAVLMCTLLTPAFTAVLLAYFATTCIYSFWLKNQVVVDVILLASLYTSRILAGAAATSIAPSFWLLAFSMFIFLSLAIVKRYSELGVVQRTNKTKAAGRGYIVGDLPVLLSLGTAAGYMAVVILALYVNSPETVAKYPNRWALWMVLPPLLYWISRAWMKAHRGEMHDDPIVFAATDRQSWFIAALIALSFFFAGAH